MLSARTTAAIAFDALVAQGLLPGDSAPSGALSELPG
jgi:hypothetical protein